MKIDSNMSAPLIRHDVFLSFRGEDTRYNFISHLHAELCRKKIQTFIDYRLDKGDDISPALHKAIEASNIYLIVFSEDYASSTWCLEELTKILACKERFGRDVIPVFYKVDPSSVRYQKERYAEAFAKHEERFEDNMDKVVTWKNALTQAAGFSGWDSQVIRPEYTLVEKIVKDVLRKLNRSTVSDNQGIIGIEYHIEQMQSLLQLESPAIRIIGIWGMGGIGKTTIASKIYHKFSVKFDSSSCVFNSQEEIGRHGIQNVRSKYLSELLDEDLSFPYKRLKRTKVLLILDDVNNSVQLQDLIGRRGNFGGGSRIIVTSRDRQVLKSVDPDEIYQVREMSFVDSLKLFSLYAFKQDHPRESYMDLSVKLLNYAKGIPLALKVLGSFLHDRTMQAWESELQKLEKLPDLKIFNALKLSYDGLDEEQKDIFLDIACFYRDHEDNVVAQTLNSCGFHANIGMDVLKDRCLISISEGKIVMHDLIQEMGQEIVRQQCISNPGERSRLWKVEDIYHVLRKNKGTDAIQCILLDICQIEEVKLHADTFKNMDNLRMLQFNNSFGYWRESNVLLLSSLESLPEALKILRWDCFPQKSLPLNFCPKNLVTLEMQHSHLRQLWKQDQCLPKLKRLDLSHSRNLIQIPDLSLIPNIEEVILSYCVSLTEVYSSGFLSKLNCLRLSCCFELRSVTIMSNILSCSSGLILLSNCRKLKTFLIHNRQPRKIGPCSEYIREEGEGNNKFLLYSEMQRQGVTDESSKFQSQNELCWLDLTNCESLITLPDEFDLSMLKFLKRLLLGGCSILQSFPEIEDTLENFAVLNLDGTAIEALPSSLCRLVGLEELSLRRCINLETIPSSIGTLTKLRKLDLTDCESLQILPNSIFNLKLTKLDLQGCSMLSTFPEIFDPAETFSHINLTKAAIKELPSSFGNLVRLQTLHLNMCTHLQSLPDSIVNLNHLEVVDCSGCGKLTETPSGICCLSLLRELSLNESEIVNLPENIAHLSNLKSLDISDCKKLECIPQLPPFLERLLAFDCPSITTVMPNSLIQFPSNSREGAFKFYFTNGQQLGPGSRANIVNDAWLRMTENAYRIVFFCFPGSAVPHWFPFRGGGQSLTINADYLNLCSDGRLIGLALCVVFQLSDVEGGSGCFMLNLKFEYDDGKYILPYEDELRDHFYWKGRRRNVDQDHTLLWKYKLESTSMSRMFCHARSLTFEIRQYYVQSIVKLKECGLCHLYAKEKDNNFGASDSGFLGLSEIDIGESSGSKVT